MCGITYTTKRNQFLKSGFGKMKYDVIHDLHVLEVIYIKNLKHPRNFGDMGTRKNLASNRRIAYVFRQYGAPPCISIFKLESNLELTVN